MDLVFIDVVRVNFKYVSIKLKVECTSQLFKHTSYTIIVKNEQLTWFVFHCICPEFTVFKYVFVY